MHLPRSATSLLLAATILVAAGCIDAAPHTVELQGRTRPDRPIVPAPPPEPSLSIDDVLEVRALLLSGDFATLDARLAWNVDSARHDSGYELRYRTYFSVPLAGDSSLRPQLDAWTESRPRSAAAHLARAAHAMALGDKARGTKWARETSPAQFASMRAWYDVARRDLVEAQALDSTSIMAHWLALGMAMSGPARRSPSGGPLLQQVLREIFFALAPSGEPVAMPYRSRREILAEGLRIVPGSLMLRWKYGYSMRPRWGGSIAELEELADGWDRDAATNPRLRLLRGLIPFDSAEALAGDDRDAEAIDMYSQALQYGDYWLYHEQRANAYWSVRRNDEAIADFDSALAQLPSLDDARAGRGYLLYFQALKKTGADSAELMRRAKLDICITAELDSTGRRLKWVLKELPDLRPASMGGEAPLSPLTAPADNLLAGHC